jgi:hypothetical protein
MVFQWLVLKKRSVGLFLGSRTSQSFSLDDFKRIFRVSRGIYDNLRNTLGGNDPFFHDGFDVTK